MERVKERLAKNLTVDAKVAKEKLKEKRIKLKKRLRAEMGEPDDEGVVLGDPDDEASYDGERSDDGGDESQSAGSEDGDGDESSISDVPLKAKRQKTSVAQTGSGASAEEKALKLLSSKTFF